MAWFPNNDQKSGWLERLMYNVLRIGPIPRHVAIIMDGNRRYASKMAIEKIEGHSLGFEKLAQETKLDEKYNLKYKKYNILRKDRNKEGGGLAFLIKNLYYEDIAINIPHTSDLEAQGIKVYLNQNKAINIYNMHYPPNNKLIDDGTMAQFLTDNNIIVGDLNAKHRLWGCSIPNPRGKILSNIFDDNAFSCA
ncbi:DHDDS [Cordylochernes scorpioides]|uniref:ditrans,polycis-polyprenyl diphosphate synthase [(2E,6E)-farnesyldiphosphate specific] n=1 Tax=Cordylochernes scorpioides TaxID=51811 RepID=A0ABY6KHR5_9ARAC|nr:DHDDS [Cordylochernes scorpioides]